MVLSCQVHSPTRRLVGAQSRHKLCRGEQNILSVSQIEALYFPPLSRTTIPTTLSRLLCLIRVEIRQFKQGKTISYLLTYLLRYTMEERPSWESNMSSACQVIPRKFWNPKVRYHSHSSQPTVPILSQIDPVHDTPTHFSVLKISSHLSLVLPSGLLPLGFPTKTLYAHLLSPIRAICSVHLSLLDLITRIILGEE